MLADSNIVIYASRPEQTRLRRFISEYVPAVSIITYIEVMGYHRLQEAERLQLEAFFQAAEILPLSEPVAAQAVDLRQQRNMSLGDAVMAATVLHDPLAPGA